MSEHIDQSLGLVQETVSRIDERVKNLLERQARSDDHINQIRDMLGNIIGRVAVLEMKSEEEAKQQSELNRDMIHELRRQIEVLTIKEEGHDSKWNRVFDLFVKIGWIVIAAYVLYSLKLPPPSVSGLDIFAFFC